MPHDQNIICRGPPARFSSPPVVKRCDGPVMMRLRASADASHTCPIPRVTNEVPGWCRHVQHGERFCKATQTLERVSSTRPSASTVSQFRPLRHPRAKQARCKQIPRRPDSEAGPASTNHAALPAIASTLAVIGNDGPTDLGQISSGRNRSTLRVE